jgi:hypothetical protein
MDPVSELERGACELAAALGPAGFAFVLLQYPFGDPRLVGQGWLRAGSGHAEADLPGS